MGQLFYNQTTGQLRVITDVGKAIIIDNALATSVHHTSSHAGSTTMLQVSLDIAITSQSLFETGEINKELSPASPVSLDDVVRPLDAAPPETKPHPQPGLPTKRRPAQVEPAWAAASRRRPNSLEPKTGRFATLDWDDKD